MKIIKLTFKFLVCSILCYSILSCQQATKTKKEFKRPNILLVVADDLGWTDLGSFGSEIKTPNLDLLAKRGVMFTDFHTSMSCSPTRSMLLTGTDNHIAGMGNMDELLTDEQMGQPGYEGYLNDRVVSLAEVLKENGYHTYMGGKWHLGHQPDRIPHARGFERSFSMLDGGASFWQDMIGPLAKHPFSTYVMDEKVLEELPGDFYATQSYTDFLMESIRINHGDDRPFLAYLAFTTPHDPLHVPEPWRSMYQGEYDEGYGVLKTKRVESAKKLGLVPSNAPVPESFSETRSWESLSKGQQAIETRAMEVYAGMVSNLDYHYGRIEAFLKDIGELENTIIIFLSDNGPNPWYSEDYPSTLGSGWFEQFDNSANNIGNPMSHHAYGIGWSEASAGPLNLFKLTVCEGGIRVPMFIDGPGIEGEKRYNSFTYVWDIMPTILDMAGIEHPESYRGRTVDPMRGKSMKGVLSGAKTMVYDKQEFICGELGGDGMWSRQGNYKAVWNQAPYGNLIWHLYNLADDPGETKDLSNEMPEKLKELQEAWNEYAKEVGVVLSEK